MVFQFTIRFPSSKNSLVPLNLLILTTLITNTLPVILLLKNGGRFFKIFIILIRDKLKNVNVKYTFNTI